MAFTFVAAGEPLLAADIRSQREAYPDEGPGRDGPPSERKVAEYCLSQRVICRKICRLRFRDDDIGCPQACESRVPRCISSGCFRWKEPEFVIAERFGGYQCIQ